MWTKHFFSPDVGCALLHKGPSLQTHEDICQTLDVALWEEEVIEYGYMLEEEYPYPSLNHQDQVNDAYLEDCAEKEIHELESMSSEDDEEDLDPKSLQVLQERMMEYEESCK